MLLVRCTPTRPTLRADEPRQSQLCRVHIVSQVRRAIQRGPLTRQSGASSREQSLQTSVGPATPPGRRTHTHQPIPAATSDRPDPPAGGSTASGSPARRKQAQPTGATTSKPPRYTSGDLTCRARSPWGPQRPAAPDPSQILRPCCLYFDRSRRHPRRPSAAAKHATPKPSTTSCSRRDRQLQVTPKATDSFVFTQRRPIPPSLRPRPPRPPVPRRPNPNGPPPTTYRQVL